MDEAILVVKKWRNSVFEFLQRPQEPNQKRSWRTTLWGASSGFFYVVISYPKYFSKWPMIVDAANIFIAFSLVMMGISGADASASKPKE